MARSEQMTLYQYVNELVTCGAAVLTQQGGLSDEAAKGLMLEIAQRLCETHAANTVYIPAAKRLADLKRNATIWAEYQQDNPEPPYTKRWTSQRAWELAKKYDLTPQRIYIILKQERLDELAEVQPELDGVSDPMDRRAEAAQTEAS